MPIDQARAKARKEVENMRTRGILETPEPISNENFLILHDRILSIESKLTQLERIVMSIDHHIQDTLVSEATAKIRQEKRGGTNDQA